MGTHARARPKRLAEKLLAIRKQLDLSQSQIAVRIGLKKVKQGSARVSEYETNVREPDLFVLLAYARLARVPVEQIIDDNLRLEFIISA